MRATQPLLLVVILLVAPVAAAEWGDYGEDGFPINVYGESTNPAMAGPLNVVGGTTLFPYWPVLTLEVERMAAQHPDLVRLHSAGKSHLGLDLWMLEIADFGNPDMKPLEAREVVWIDGGTHSNEYSGVYFTAHLASFLLDEYATNETAQWIVENRHTWLMPLVNPDGANTFGRLNAQLVNINRNYPVAWGALNENPLFNNPGPEPESEIETRINIEWFNRTQPDYYASIHCCGNLWLYPYGVEGMDPVDNEVLSRVCDEAFPTVRSDCGPIWSTIYPASGSSVDTAYEYTGAVAWGFEMSGRGAIALWGQPFTTESVRVQEVESWEGVMHAFAHVHKYGAYPVVADAHIEDGALVVDVRNDGYGNLTRGTLSFGAQALDLPFLAPGESTRFTFTEPLADGAHKLRFDYVKRVMAEPTGTRGVMLMLADDGGALRVASHGDMETEGGAVVEPASTPARGVPGPGVALVLGALALAQRMRPRER